MITARKANEKTFKSEKAKELLTRKHYLEILLKIENKIIETAESGCFCIDLKTDFMYPFRDKVMDELIYSGYKVVLKPATGILPEYILISWK